MNRHTEPRRLASWACRLILIGLVVLAAIPAVAQTADDGATDAEEVQDTDQETVETPAIAGTDVNLDLVGRTAPRASIYKERFICRF